MKNNVDPDQLASNEASSSGSTLFFMPPTLKKLKGHIAFGLSVRLCVHPSMVPLQNLLRYSFEISYMDSSSKIIDTYFFLSLCGVMPLLKGHTEIL